MLPVYWVDSVIVATGVPPVAGTVTPRIPGISITAAAVAGNMAVTTPELIGLVSDVTPATVKKSAATPVKVNPALAVSVMVAV